MGKFISIEGGEGVGKSSFLLNLESSLKQAGHKTMTTREPGGTKIAQKIRTLFMSPPEDEVLEVVSELFLVSAARCQHVSSRILPGLKSDNWVLCDRFHDSTRVYQGIGGSLPEGQIESIIALSTGGLDPDLTFILDCDVKTALSRIDKRNANNETQESGNRYDEASYQFHQTLRSGFLRLKKTFPDRIVVLDASQAPEAVLDDAVRHINNRFGMTL